MLPTRTLSCVDECGAIAPTQRKLDRHKESCEFALADQRRTGQKRSQRQHAKDTSRHLKRQKRLEEIAARNSLSSLPSADGRAMAPASIADNPTDAMEEGDVDTAPDVSISEDLDMSPAMTTAPRTPTHEEMVLNEPTLTAAGRPARRYRVPARYRNQVPVPPTALEQPLPPAVPLLPRVRLLVRDSVTSLTNAFGVFRRYWHRPSYDPDASLRVEDLAARPAFAPHPMLDRDEADIEDGDAPTVIPATDTSTPAGATEPQAAASVIAGLVAAGFEDAAGRATVGTEDSAARHDAVPDVRDPSERFEPPWPYSNITIYRIMAWLNNGKALKTEAELTAFVKDVMDADDYDPAHIRGFDARQENARLSTALAEAGGEAKATAFYKQFKETKVTIEVPTGRAGAPAATYEVPGLLHMDLTSIIKAAFQDSLAQHLHYTPYELHHTSDNGESSQRLYGELYNSPAFLEEHDRVHFKAPTDDPSCKRERVVAAIMLASDGTHLANFGSAKAWPVYLMLGNHSKYIRAVPGSGAIKHLAYIPSLPSDFATFGERVHAKWKTQKKDITTHCRRELMHAVWKVILDDDFVHAYEYGMVVECLDGIERRVYPRIFTYSADYPEKVLLASIRDGGLCPCPRCFVAKSKLDRMGLKRDMKARIQKARTYLSDRVRWARNAIYKLAHPIGGKVVDTLLKDYSAVPTQNAFAERLGHDFNPSSMLVVDLLHEFELGVWKATFTHLIRILYAIDPQGSLVEVLNQRFRQIDTFGRATIRKFSAKECVSEMKKMAARDFEDILQCSIPCFDRLLQGTPNTHLLKLLYRMSEWHALAKARMHTDATLELLDTLTQEFGQLMREFEQMSRSYATVELPKEASARVRRDAQKAAAAAGRPPPSASAIAAAPKSSKTKRLNLSTYKFHALGDYVRSIKLYGTTDSYSTQLSELAHRLVKKLYLLTNKKNAMKQIATKYTRLDFFRQMEKREMKELKNASADEPYVIAKSRKHHFDMMEFGRESKDDPARAGFVRKLRDHLLGRRLNRQFDGDDFDFTDDDRRTIHIKNSRIYESQVIRVNYTTYDVRRDYDCISARRRGFVMTRSPETGDDVHPYWYAQVLGVYRADVRHTGMLSTDLAYRQMDFLWVRWLGKEVDYRWGREHARLPKVGFIPDSMPDAFGFLDPSLIIRGAHLIPSFADERTTELLRAGPSACRLPGVEDDWTNYYVGIFVDRDMYVRHLGGGVGHLDSSCRFAAAAAYSSAPDTDDEEQGSGVQPSASHLLATPLTLVAEPFIQPYDEMGEGEHGTETDSEIDDSDDEDVDANDEVVGGDDDDDVDVDDMYSDDEEDSL